MSVDRTEGLTVAETHQELESRDGEGELRSVAQLKMLHSLAPRLGRLNDVEQIGEAITAELKTLID